jgi:hypothetical protein
LFDVFFCSNHQVACFIVLPSKPPSLGDLKSFASQPPTVFHLAAAILQLEPLLFKPLLREVVIVQAS